MKKKIFNGLSVSDIRKMVHNTLDQDGKMAELKAALDKLFDEMEAAEIDYTVEDFKAEIKKLIDAAVEEKSEEEKEKVAESISKRFQALQNSIQPKAKELPAQVRNQICAAVLRAKGQEFVEDEVKAVLAKNGISGLSFNEVIDYTIADEWGKTDNLFGMLKKTPISKFYYTSQALKTAAVLAKQWDKTGESEKVIQQIEVSGKTISTQYIYKRQQIAREDLDEIEKNASVVLTWLNEELDRQIINTIIIAILIGDSINESGDQVTVFETIGSKTSTDLWTTVSNPASEGAPTFAECRAAADAVKNPNGLKKVAIVSTSRLTALSEYLPAAGATVLYRSREEVAAQLGVDEIYVTDILDNTDVHCIVMLPDEYWVNEKKSIAVTYPTYEKNVVNYQKERNIGGKIHGLHSTAVLRDAE